jgi:hypothetical protein
MEHPSSVDWALFLRSGVPVSRSVEMAEHLGKCGLCRAVFDELRSPPRRILGRPLPAHTGVRLLDLEAETRKLLDSIRQSPVIRIGGSWHSETLLYQVLALAVARLERQGCGVAIAGLVRSGDTPPPVPNHPIAVLLEAPSYVGFDSWLKPQAGQTLILTGETEVWLRRGSQPDIVMENSTVESDLATYLERIEGGVRGASPVVRAGVLANALLVDWPRALIEPDYLAGSPMPFVSVEDLAAQSTGYVSVEGQWLASHFLRRDPQLAAALRHDLEAVEPRLPENARSRLARQWHQLFG